MRKPYLLTYLLTYLLCLTVSSTAHAATFHLEFDNMFGSIPDVSSVGSGVISFDNNLADGTYSLSSLSNLSMSFDFGVDNFTYADMSNPADSLAITIDNSGTLFYFDGTESNTDYGGSIDFINSLSGRYLSIQPNNLGLSTPYNLYQTNDFFGSYHVSTASSSPIATPIPAAVWLFASGLVGLTRFRKKQRPLSSFNSSH